LLSFASCAATTWWKEYAERKNDEEQEHVCDSLLYDYTHLPRTAPAPTSAPPAPATAPAPPTTAPTPEDPRDDRMQRFPPRRDAFEEDDARGGSSGEGGRECSRQPEQK
jgi:hypothetical protein